MGYEVIENWVFRESDDPDDESRKEVQIVRHEGHDGIYVRAPYYGPSGKYGRDAPTYDISEDTQEKLIEALEEAFPKAREIKRKRKIEKTFDETNLDPSDLQKLADMAERAGGVDELLDQLGDGKED